MLQDSIIQFIFLLLSGLFHLCPIWLARESKKLHLMQRTCVKTFLKKAYSAFDSAGLVNMEAKTLSKNTATLSTSSNTLSQELQSFGTQTESQQTTLATRVGACRTALLAIALLSI